MFGNMTTDGLEQAQDRLGGFSLKETDIYPGTIKAAYAGKSEGGAMNITLIVDLAGSEYRETIYISNKKGENFFLNPQDNTKKVPLPGFTTINDICLIAVGKPLSEMGTEEKVFNVYDKDAKRELPKTVQMLTELIGGKIALGIVKSIVNKSEKDAAGVYQPTAETREENTIDKVFHPEEKKTVAEAVNGQDGGFWDKWLEKNKGKTIDKRKVKDGQAGSSSRPAPAAGGQSSAAPARQSLFGGKK